jgi:acylphosphatase
VFEGEPGAVSSMVDWCSRGPRGAEVESVDESSEQPQGLSAFEIR